MIHIAFTRGNELEGFFKFLLNSSTSYNAFVYMLQPARIV